MVLALMVVAGCTNCQRSTGAEGNADDDGYNSADSMKSALGDAATSSTPNNGDRQFGT